MVVSVFITLAVCELLLALAVDFLPTGIFFFFFKCVNNHVPTCPGTKLNLGGPKELCIPPCR